MSKWFNSGLWMCLFGSILIGCGQGFESSGVSSSSVQATDVSSEMQKAERVHQDAQSAMLSAQDMLKLFADTSGNINIKLFMPSGSGANPLAEITEKSTMTFAAVLERMSGVKEQFAQSRQLVMAAIAKLNHNNPNEALLINQLMAQMRKIDLMEKQFDRSSALLAAKLDLLINGLDKIASGLTNFIPGFGWLVGIALDYFVMGDIKALILEFKMKLLLL